MAQLSALDKFHVKKFLKEITSCKGRHTELVSVYVPAGYDLNLITNLLSQEQGTATNIKSKGTRDNVIGALEKMLQHLKLFKQTPPNGLAIFAGNVSEREGQQNFQVWSIEPPVALNFRTYRCDKEFVTEPLKDLLGVKEVYALIVFDRRDADIALLKGKSIIHLRKTHSEVPGKHKTGGQSAQRFERLRDGAAKEHYKKIAEYMKDEFLHMTNLKGIIIGGPGVTVNLFMDHDYITGDLKKKIIGTKDLSYTGEFGLQELLEKSSDLLASEEVSTEKKIMAKFFTLMLKEPGKVSYGKVHVEEMIAMGAVETLLLSEALEDDEMEAYEKKAQELGTIVKIISTETREGVQLREIGKVAAILRYDTGHSN